MRVLIFSEGKQEIVKNNPYPIFCRDLCCIQVPFSFADDDHVVAAGIDPSIVHQVDITFDKYIAMKNEIIKDHGDMYCNFKRSGSHGEMYQFCQGEWQFLFFVSFGADVATPVRTWLTIEMLRPGYCSFGQDEANY